MSLKESAVFLTENESDKRLSLVHDRGNLIMNINDLKTIEKLEQFLTGTQSIAFLVASNKKEIYRDIQRTLVKFRYPTLNKGSKGLVVCFLIKITGCSRQQLTRLIKQYCDTPLCQYDLRHLPLGN